MSRRWLIPGVSAVCFFTGVTLSHPIEPGAESKK
jgi:hypothetical protein